MRQEESWLTLWTAACALTSESWSMLAALMQASYSCQAWQQFLCSKKRRRRLCHAFHCSMRLEPHWRR